MVFALPCPLPAICLWKNFSQRIGLIREVRTRGNKRKQRRPNNNNKVIRQSHGYFVLSQGL